MMAVSEWEVHGAAWGLSGASRRHGSKTSCQARGEQSPRVIASLQAAAACDAALPVVVQHDAVWCFIIAETDMVVQLCQLLAEGYQLILCCIQHALALCRCVCSGSQLRLQPCYPFPSFTVTAL